MNNTTTHTNHNNDTDTANLAFVRGGFGHVKVRIEQQSDDAPIAVYAVTMRGILRIIATFEPGPSINFEHVVRMAEDSALGEQTRQREDDLRRINERKAN